VRVAFAAALDGEVEDGELERLAADPKGGG